MSVLDVGAGGGEVDAFLQSKYKVKITAIDVTPPSKNVWRFSKVKFPVKVFDGKHLKFEDNSFDVVLFNSVLHHAAKNTPSLLKDAARVSRRWILLNEDTSVTDSTILSKEDIDFIEASHLQHERYGVFRTVGEWTSLLEDVAGARVLGVGIVADGCPPNKHKPEGHREVTDPAIRQQFQRFFVASVQKGSAETLLSKSRLTFSTDSVLKEALVNVSDTR